MRHGIMKTFRLDGQRVTDKYQKCKLEQLWVFPPIRGLHYFPAGLSGTRKHSLCVTNKALRTKSYAGERSLRDAERPSGVQYSLLRTHKTRISRLTGLEGD